MSATHEQAVEVLNAAKLASDAQHKVDHLRSLLELAVRKEPALLPELLPEVLEMQVDPAAAVRRFLPELIDGAVAANPCPPVLTPSLACLRTLCADSAAATARRAVQSCYAAFRAAYALVALRAAAGGAEEAADGGLAALREVWAAATALKLAAAHLVAGEAAAEGGEAGGGVASDGVRQGAARFLEQAVLLLTAEVVPAVAGLSAAPSQLPPAHPLLSRAVLVRDAEAGLARLVALLKQPLGPRLSPALAATAVRSAAGIAKERPQFMGRLLPPLMALAGSDAVKAAAKGAAGAAPAGTDAVVAALRAALQMLQRSPAPAAQPWKKKIAAALEGLGVKPDGGQAHSEDGRREKRPHEGGDEPAKRQRSDSAAPATQQQQQTAGPPAGAAVPQLPPLPPLPPLPAAAPGAALSPPTPADQLSKVLAVVEALAAACDASMLAGVVGSLQPGVLADLVLALLPRLPATGSLPPDGAPLEPWAEQLLALVAAQAPLHMPPAAPGQPAAAAGGPERTPTPPLPAQQQQGQQQGQQQLGQQGKQEAAPQAQPQVQPKPLPVPVAALAAAFRLEPVSLTEGQQRALRLAAVLRILRTQKTSRQGLRTSLVAKLAAEAQEAAGQGPAIMRELVQGMAAGSSHSADEGAGGADLEVALQWLDLLYARECQPQPAEGEEGGTGTPEPAAAKEDDAGSGGERAGSPANGTAAAAAQQRPRKRQRLEGGGSAYERTLVQLLQGVREQLPPTNKVLVRVLLEAPALPQPAIRSFLEQLAGVSPEWCTLALLAARDAILYRPPSRQALLAMVLDACTSPSPDLRSKSVRLVANRLFPDAGMAPQIEAAARRRLDAMVPPPREEPAGAAAGKAAAAAAAGVADGAAAGAGEAASGGAAAGEAAAAAGGEEAAAAAGEAGGAAQVEKAAEGEATAVAAVKAEPAEEGPPAAAPPPESQPAAAAAAEEAPAGPSAAEAAQLCALYCALCTKKHSLLRHLFEVYAQTSDGGRAAIQRNAGGLAKTLGASAAALLAVVTDPPAGSLPLVLQMLHVLTDASVPHPIMVSACLQLHERCRDARVLVPALRGVNRGTALRLLPALLDLQPEQLRPALQRLVAPLPAADAAAGGEGQASARPPAPAVVSPEELLSALHTLDHSRDAGLLRRMMQAVTVCISSPALFPPESLAACISQLLTRVPLPQLFMRTVIQTVSAAPRLRAFVVGVLRQLVGKHIWKDATQWKGWLMCAQQTVPDSFPALLGLPPDVLASAAKAMPATTKQQLLEYAEQPGTVVPATTLAALRQEAQTAAA